MNPNAKQLPIDHLDDIVGSIVSTVPTDAIYVFGSYARGEQTPDSDVDLYVVTKDAAKRPLPTALGSQGASLDEASQGRALLKRRHLCATLARPLDTRIHRRS